MQTEPDTLSNEDWKKRLSPEQYRVLREHGTEAPFTGELLDCKAEGNYLCAGCGAVLFDSTAKFDSGTGWPSFTEVANTESVKLLEDSSHGMRRTEVRCANCDGHLGHVFPDGPGPSGQRFCINSCALSMDEK